MDRQQSPALTITCSPKEKGGRKREQQTKGEPTPNSSIWSYLLSSIHKFHSVSKLKKEREWPTTTDNVSWKHPCLWILCIRKYICKAMRWWEVWGEHPSSNLTLLFLGDELFILFKTTLERLCKCHIFKCCLHMLYMSPSAFVPTLAFMAVRNIQMLIWT